MPNHTHFCGEFWGHLPPKFNSNYSYPQKAHLWVKTRRLSHQPSKSIQGFDLGAYPRKKSNRTGQPKKAHRRYISHIWGEAPANDNATKFVTGVDVQDVITHAKF